MNKLLGYICLGLYLIGCSDNKNTVTEPSTYLLSSEQLASYEASLDHATLIKSWNQGAFRRGQATYRKYCYSCHGDEHQPGSLPNSRKFWSDSLHNGHSPLQLYQTITRGWGQMPPQVHLSPREKYDVIHFVRENFIRDKYPDAYFEVDESWLSNLPSGDTIGPEPKPYHPWEDMDYGNWLIHCYEVADSSAPPKVISGGRSPLPNEDYSEVNFAYKGIAIRLNSGPGGVARGNAFALFDHDLMRLAGVWTGEGFIDWEDILLDDQHNVYPRTWGALEVSNPVIPGWANPENMSFKDPRIRGLDGRPFGPLPKAWSAYKGLYKHNDQIIIKYSVDKCTVLETFGVNIHNSSTVFKRILNASSNSRALKMRIAPITASIQLLSDHAFLSQEGGYHILNVPANQSCRATIFFAKESFDPLQEPLTDLHQFTNGDAVKVPPSISAGIVHQAGPAAYDVDIFTLPVPNPWNSRVRPTGLDFINGGQDAVVCTIDGVVWKVKNITQISGEVTWQRIATGLFQPLGIKYHNDTIYVGCRDQIVKLVDLDNDEEIEYYECFNSDHQVTEHFHEFAMGLQTDNEGNFYYAKSGRHARTSLVPQHGTLIKVSADGSTSTILANGFRAANGVCLNPDGSFYVTDQEGYWNPKNRVNRVEQGGFYGNMWGYGPPDDTSDAAMEMPLVWIDNKYDRSPAELLWSNSERWGPLNGSLLSLSYGNGKIFKVLTQNRGGTFQGAFVELPLPQFPTGLIRGRMNHSDGQLYVCGMSAWATNQMLQTGGMYRIRYIPEKNICIPTSLEFMPGTISLSFSSSLDDVQTTDFTVRTWELKRTRRYGSERLNEKELEVSHVTMEEQGQKVVLHVADLAPTWIIEILYNVSSDHKNISGALQGTIYTLDDISL